MTPLPHTLSTPAVHRAAALVLVSASLSGLAHGADIVPLRQRIAAAQATAQQGAHCLPAQPFYWEVGNSQHLLAGGRVGADAPARDTKMSIASASKWVYAAYVAERRGGQLTALDVRFLHFESGYTRFHMCTATQTVMACQTSLLNGLGQPDASTAGYFYYNGGHMQKHATLMGLGPLNKDGLAAAVREGLGALGSDWSFDYVQAQPAGGGATDAGDYARFLRGLMTDTLQLGPLLGAHAVCANPLSCPDQALKTPIPTTETWHYALGHWVEDDPQVGDGSFSSPGAFGFYPWIDANKRFYGIVARDARQGVLGGTDGDKPAVVSVQCGRDIRAAWMDGQPR